MGGTQLTLDLIQLGGRPLFTPPEDYGHLSASWVRVERELTQDCSRDG
jgi:hypothetical protein